MIKSEEIEKACIKLKPLLGKDAINLWYTYLASDEDDRKDLECEIEILNEKLLTRESLEKKPVFLPPPKVKDSKGSIYVGDTIYNDKTLHPVYLKPEDFTKQIGIFAVTGEGKTNLAYLLALQLLKKKHPFMVIDWKRSWRSLLSLRDTHPELEKLEVYTIGRKVSQFYWNPFRGPPGSDKDSWISAISDTLEKSHLSGQGVAYHFNRIYKNLFKGLTDDFYPNFFDGLKEVEKLKVTMRELKWKQTALRIFQSFTTGIAIKSLNSRNPVKLEDLLGKPVIFELDMEMPKPLRIFFSEILLKWIHLYRLGQGETDKLRHVLFLEEAHNVFTQTGYDKDTNVSLENIYREIRAFGQGLVSITQHPSTLPVYLLGNCHTQIFLGLQHADDINAANKSLFLKKDEETYLGELKVGECILKIKNRIDPCHVRSPLIPIKKGFITDNWLKNHKLSQLFRKYSLKPTEKINSSKENPSQSSINTPGYLKNQFKNGSHDATKHSPSKHKKYPVNNRKQKDKNNQPGAPNNFLIDINSFPFSSTTERYKRLNLNPNFGNKLKNQLIKQNYIRPCKITTAWGWITLYDFSKKARLQLRDLGHENKYAKEGIEHRYWKNEIAKVYKTKGFRVFVEEYYVNGKPDIIAIKYNKKIAIEIETGKSKMVYNVKKTLGAGFEKIICVGVNKYIREKLKKSLKEERIRSGRVIVVSAQELTDERKLFNF